MNEWGSEYGKNPIIKKTPQGEPYMKTGDSVKDEPPLTEFYHETKAWMVFRLYIRYEESKLC